MLLYVHLTYPNAKLQKTINDVIVLYSFFYPIKYKEYILMSKIM